MASIGERKESHLDLAVGADIAFRRTTLLECVELVHDALPELSLDEISTEVTVLGKSLRAPLLIAGMTGGNQRAGMINRELAGIAEEGGYAFGLGSQRPLLMDADAIDHFEVRSIAPTTLILANIGGVQAVEYPTDRLRWLVDRVGADALCVHLNPAMELVQPEGDRDFRGVLQALARLVKSLDVPLVVKETGCGISSRVAARLAEVGVRHVDVSGAGGTSWVAIETERTAPERRHLGNLLREWGVPTAASLLACVTRGFQTVMATGGIQRGLDVAKSLALGATIAGLARPVLVAQQREGAQGARRLLKMLELELRAVMLLVGARDLAALRQTPRRLSGELLDWLRDVP